MSAIGSTETAAESLILSPAHDPFPQAPSLDITTRTNSLGILDDMLKRI